MSWEASGIVKKLKTAIDGTPFTRDAKFIYLLLADYHNTARRVAWPSREELADNALMPERHVRRQIIWLEEHGEIALVRPEKQGRGCLLSYRFLRLESMEAKGDTESPFTPDKGGLGSHPFPGQKGDVKGDAKGDKRVTKGCQGEQRNKEEQGTKSQVQNARVGIEQKQDQPQKPKPHIPAEPAWAAIREALAQSKLISRHSLETWLEPLKGLEFAGDVLRVSVPAKEFLHIAEKFAGEIKRCVLESGLAIAAVEFTTERSGA